MGECGILYDYSNIDVYRIFSIRVISFLRARPSDSRTRKLLEAENASTGGRGLPFPIWCDLDGDNVDQIPCESQNPWGKRLWVGHTHDPPGDLHPMCTPWGDEINDGRKMSAEINDAMRGGKKGETAARMTGRSFRFRLGIEREPPTMFIVTNLMGLGIKFDSGEKKTVGRSITTRKDSPGVVNP